MDPMGVGDLQNSSIEMGLSENVGLIFPMT